MSKKQFKPNNYQGGNNNKNKHRNKHRNNEHRVQKNNFMNKKVNRVNKPTQKAPAKVPVKGPLFDKSKLVTSWSINRKAGPGLMNGMNTCFLNSVLECLTYTPPLAQQLLKEEHQASCRMDGFCALCAMELHVRRSLKDPKSFAKGAAIMPKYFTSNLKALSKTLRLGRQEDAHELYMFMLSAFQKASIQGLGKLPPAVEESAFIYQVFGGKLRSQLKCYSCNATSNNYEACLDLSVDLTNKAKTVEQALANFTKVDIIGSDDPNNKYKCDACKQMVKAGKQMTIDELPLMCTIHLKRFAFDMEYGYMRKITSKVEFPETLDLAPYVSEEKSVQKAEYNLYAVLVHAGFGCDSGHYYAYIKAPNGKWYNADDDFVAPVSVSQVLKEHAYMLFYQQSEIISTPTAPASTTAEPPTPAPMTDKEEQSTEATALVSEAVSTLPQAIITTETLVTAATPQQVPTAKATLSSTTNAATLLPPTSTSLLRSALKKSKTQKMRSLEHTKRNVHFVEPIVKADNPKAWTVQLSTQSHRSLRGNLSPPTYSANVNDLSSWTVRSQPDFLRKQKSKKRRVFRVKLESKKSAWTVNPY